MKFFMVCDRPLFSRISPSSLPRLAASYMGLCRISRTRASCIKKPLKAFSSSPYWRYYPSSCPRESRALAYLLEIVKSLN
jgi:hypothetical protein